MVVEQKVRERVLALRRDAAGLLDGIERSQNNGEGWSWEARAEAWVVSAVSVVCALVPDELEPYRQQAKTAADYESTRYRVTLLDALLDALVQDVDAGLVGALREQVRAEVFDDYLDQADAYLDAGQLQMAGSIASVVFEDTIKRACAKHVEVVADGADLDQRINALKAAGKLTKSRAAMAKGATALRNQALHADWTFSVTEVRLSMDLTRALIVDLLGG